MRRPPFETLFLRKGEGPKGGGWARKQGKAFKEPTSTTGVVPLLPEEEGCIFVRRPPFETLFLRKGEGPKGGGWARKQGNAFKEPTSTTGAVPLLPEEGGCIEEVSATCTHQRARH